MRFTSLVGAILVGAASVSANDHSARHGKRHHDLAAREPAPAPVEERAANVTEAGVEKRGNDARFTFYDVGLGACGQVNVPSDFIVALNTPQYGSGSPGPQCFKMITITYNGKSTQAQIMDECPGCPYRGLDMSRGLFDFFASEDAGVIYGDWSFSDGSGSAGSSSSSSSTWVAPTTSSTWVAPTTSSSVWTPTSTWTPPATTSSTWSSSSEWSSSSSSWSSSSSSWSSSSESSSWSSSTEVPTSSVDFSSGGLAVSTGSGALAAPTGTAANIYNMNLALIEMGAIINAGNAN